MCTDTQCAQATHWLPTHPHACSGLGCQPRSMSAKKKVGFFVPSYTFNIFLIFFNAESGGLSPVLPCAHARISGARVCASPWVSSLMPTWGLVLPWTLCAVRELDSPVGPQNDPPRGRIQQNPTHWLLGVSFWGPTGGSTSLPAQGDQGHTAMHGDE